jgi:hypothetical protein
MTYGIFRAYGLFWRIDEINWTPGKGKRREFRLLGRRGSNLPGLQVADFRKQQGIYILYGNYGPYYVGLTHRQTLGKRLKDHLSDHHSNRWDRFSWFSFCKVQKATDDDGMQTFDKLPGTRVSDPRKAMKDIEAILIKAMALTNIAQMNFAHASEWFQIKERDASHFLYKLSSK